MIVSRCPVRVSLAGGSTDLESFVEKYGRGTVIGFSANVYNYITVKSDRLGLNGLERKYVIDYMKREVVDSVNDIKNDVARVALNHFEIDPTTVWFTSDIYASGSGLASSTSYLIALINALQNLKGIKANRHQVCKLAHELEKQFNPLTGYQDPYSCGMGGFNKFDFRRGGFASVESLDSQIFDPFDMYLVHTGQARSSTDILKTIDPDKCVSLLKTADDMHSVILKNDSASMLELINEGWRIKKMTGKIAEDVKVIEIDEILESSKDVLAHRLLGAGNGGYFLVFVKKGSKIHDVNVKLREKMVKIDVCHAGPTCIQVR